MRSPVDVPRPVGAELGQKPEEVAAEVFVSPQTVESHLKHIYAKLGIRSRMQLARRLVKSHD